MKKLLTKTLLMAVCLLLGGVNYAWGDDITITWPMVDANNAITQAGSANADGVVTVNNASLSTAYSSLAWADSRNLSYSDGAEGDNGNYKFYAGGVAITNNPNTDNNNASVNTNCYVKFSFTVAAGMKFTPTGFSFDCGRAGTDAGCVQGTLVLADDSKSESSITRPARTDKKFVYDSHVSKTITGADAFDSGSTVNFYIYIGGKLNGKTLYLANVTITGTYEVPATPPGAVSFSPAAGSVAEGTPITLTSSGSTTIEYQWGASVVDGNGDWTSATTYSGSSKPVVPAAGSTNRVLSVKATNDNGSTYGSATYIPVKMALKTIYSFADGIGSQEVTAIGKAETPPTIDGTSSMSLKNTGDRIKLTAATGFEFENGDEIEFSGSIGNTSKAYGIKYGPTDGLGTNLFVAAGEACHVSSTLTLESATSDLYIGRYDGSTTIFTTFTIRRLTAATSEGFTGAVKINGSTATEGEDYTKEGNVYTLTAEYSTMPAVCLVNHIVFADDSTEDQDVLVAFGAPDGEYFTGIAEIDGTTYTVKAPCGQINALKVVYKDGDTTVKEENITVTSSMKVGASYTVPFRMYVDKDGALYKTTKNGSNPYYGDAVTLAYNTTVTKSVSSVDLGGGTLVLLEDLDGDASQNADIRASNCSASTTYTSASNLPAGKYTFIVKAMNKGRGSSVKVGETTVFTISDVISSNNSWTDKTFTDVVVPADGKLTLVKGGNNTIDYYDILIAIRTGDATVSGTITPAGWSSFASSYPLDLSTLNATSGATAYYASAADGNTVTLTSTTATVPAGEGLMIKGNAGETFTIGVAAGGTAINGNLLKAGDGTEVAASTAGAYHYVFGYKKPDDVVTEYGFYNLADPTIVPAGKAYLETALVAGARSLSIVFDDETTGIENFTPALPEGEGAVYNLRGQRVAQPTKGLYIVNGKKVIIK